MTDTQRLSKRITELYQCSRREAELLIEGGWVLVNGEVIDEPQHQVGNETIALHPQARAEPVPPMTLLLHLPAGASVENTLQNITAASHMAEDKSGIRLLRRHFHRQEGVLELQAGMYGLQVFTQDWKVARKLKEDGALLEQEIIVDVAARPAADVLPVLNEGLKRWHTSAKVSWQSDTRLRFALKAPQAKQLRELCGSAGLDVLGMKRLRIGSVGLAGLPAGQWRYLGLRERF
ncbi:MAG: RNA pseudouridine synthase [Pedobacter sp.]|nr:RNA pseudouridine synthase [Pedobacter sp.]